MNRRFHAKMPMHARLSSNVCCKLNTSFVICDGHRSSCRSPVSVPIFASAAGPISSPSWKQNVKFDQPSRCNLRCDPTCFFSVQPIL